MIAGLTLENPLVMSPPLSSAEMLISRHQVAIMNTKANPRVMTKNDVFSSFGSLLSTRLVDNLFFDSGLSIRLIDKSFFGLGAGLTISSLNLVLFFVVAHATYNKTELTTIVTKD